MGGLDRHGHRANAFSLVELIIVVAVLGILGAAVAGRYGDTADRAREAAGKVALNTVKAAIARYQADHGGQSPAFATLTEQLTRPTNYAGDVGKTKNATYRFGPYLPQMPRATLRRTGRSAVVASDDFQEQIWYYSESSGRLYGSAEYAQRVTSTSLQTEDAGID